MRQILIGIVWTSAIWLGLLGWGDILRRSLRIRCGAAETACLGVGAAIAAGGVLNLFHLCLPPVDAGFVLIDAAAGIRSARVYYFSVSKFPVAFWPEFCWR